MREPEAPEHTIEKLVGVYRVLIPRLIAAYTYHLNGTSRITDAPTIRSLKFTLQDEFEDWRDGEMLLQSLIDTPEKVERAARRQQELEKLVLASGGIAGPGSLGEPRAGGSQSHEEDAPRVRAGPRRALRPHQDRGSHLRPARRQDRAAQHRPGQDGRPTARPRPSGPAR